jgi:hypothetical protein
MTGGLIASALSSQDQVALPGFDLALSHAEARSEQWRDGLCFMYNIPLSLSDHDPKFVSSTSTAAIEYVETSTFLHAFYKFFHSAHPIMPPQKYVLEKLNSGLLPHALKCAIRFNSSFFMDNITTGSFGDSIENLFGQHTPRDAYTVQAMILFAIGLHGNNNVAESSKLQHLATEMALEIGMHRKEFASSHGEGSEVIEESWRRTWWELYILDGLLAGVCGDHSLRLYEIKTDVPLPCEESEYKSGVSLFLPLGSFISMLTLGAEYSDAIFIR